MRVLIIHRYFWPDTPPYGWMLRAIARRWADDRHDVTVLTSQPSYGASMRKTKQPRVEYIDGFQVRRVGLLPESKSNFLARGINLGLFMLRLFGRIVFHRPRYDIAMAATTPPVMVSWAASLAAKLRGTDFFYHCQDIHPELLNHAGLMKKGITYRFLLKRDIATVNRSSRVIVLSRDMRDSLQRRSAVAHTSVSVINNFTVPEFTTEAITELPEAEKNEDRFRVLFAGNLGFFQGLGTLVEAARMLQDHSNIEFVILGDGAAKSKLVKQAGDLVCRSVRFLGYRPQHEAEVFVRNADLSVITLAPNVYRAAYPSKTMTYLKMGSPILAIVEPESELAGLVQGENVGFVSPPGNIDSIVAHILQASRSPELIRRMRDNAKSACDRLFSEASRLETWSELMRDNESRRTLRPVFLVGAGRSGTKFLRDMLGAANDVAAVPFDVGYVWRKNNESISHDELVPDMLSIKARDYIRRKLPKLACAEAESRILLEKSVPNSLRVAYVRSVFPDARFVHLIRDGRAVTESALRQWQSPPGSRYLLQKLRFFPWANYRYAFWYIKNLLGSRLGGRVAVWGPRYDGMEQDVRSRSLEIVCARQWRRCVEKARTDLAEMPAADVLTIRYEDLVRDESAVKSLCQFVGTSDEAAVLNYYRNHLQAGQLQKWQANLSSGQKDEIMQEIGGLLKSLGYGSID